MANHTCQTYGDTQYGIDVYTIKTTADNIKIESFYRRGEGVVSKLITEGLYGMNGSYFNTSTSALCNIAYQDGVPQGSSNASNDGCINSVGKSLIYYKNSKLYYAANVEDDSDSRVPKVTGSWAQGGIGLYLGYSAWEEMFIADGDGEFSDDSNARTALVVNLQTNEVYLFACTIDVSVAYFRERIMDVIGISDNDSSTYWRGILLDGGRSLQIRGKNYYKASVVVRSVPQVIVVKS